MVTSLIDYLPAILEIVAAIISIVITVLGYARSKYQAIGSRRKILQMLYDFDNYANIINSEGGNLVILWIIFYAIAALIFLIPPFLFNSPDEISSVLSFYMLGGPGYGGIILLVIFILRKRANLKSLFLMSSSYGSISIFIFLGFALSLYISIRDNMLIDTPEMTIISQMLLMSFITSALVGLILLLSQSFSVSFEDEFFRKSNERVYLKVTTKQNYITGRVIGIGDTLNIQNGDGISILPWKDVIDITFLSEKRTIQKSRKQGIL